MESTACTCVADVRINEPVRGVRTAEVVVLDPTCKHPLHAEARRFAEIVAEA